MVDIQLLVSDNSRRLPPVGAYFSGVSEKADMTAVDDEVRERIESDSFCETLGIELVALEPGYARTELTVTEELLNFHGTPHGGAIYSLADAAFAAASNSHGETAVALETNISYLDAVETGETLTATAEETHLGGQTAEYEITVTDENADRIATFRGRVYRPG
jgi:acyl-CoA thioesterase